MDRTCRLRVREEHVAIGRRKHLHPFFELSVRGVEAPVD
jgi:hypothetical protein